MAHENRLNMVNRFALCLLVFAFGMASCDQSTPQNGNVENLRIGGKQFQLELAMTNATRIRGLGGRESIAENGGMLFIFPEARIQKFCMRDCLTNMDIVYIDPLGYVTAMHTMVTEPPRESDESEIEYEDRLPRYSSGYPAKFVIELAPGMAESIGIKRGGVTMDRQFPNLSPSLSDTDEVGIQTQVVHARRCTVS